MGDHIYLYIVQQCRWKEKKSKTRTGLLKEPYKFSGIKHQERLACPEVSVKSP